MQGLLYSILIILFCAGAFGAPEYRTGAREPRGWRQTASFRPIQTHAIVLPSRFDVKEKLGDLFPEIRSQRSCGSCWAFGSTRVLEIAWALKKGELLNLSEQELVSCSSHGSCWGGWFAHKWQINPGQTSEQQFPYKAKNLRCKSGLTPVANIVEYHFLGDRYGKPSIDEIKEAIFEYGSVAVTVTATSAMSNYDGDPEVFSYDSHKSINHLVTLTGWDDEKEAWLMDNSWGSKWGIDGRMWIKYGVSRIGETASYVIVE